VTNGFRLYPDKIYRCEPLQEFVWQQHGFGTKFANPQVNITLRQVHSDLVLDANGLKDREQEGDALITNQIGKAIGVRTADCVPILLIDSRKRAVAAVHAGWRGTMAGIARRAIEQMQSQFGTLPQDVYAAIGPSIQGCCYEVGADVALQFTSLFPEWLPVIGKRTIDLPEANRRQLQAAEVPLGHIFSSDLCTRCETETLFSYRREPENPGRMLSSITRLE
jgi:purine-nucleoside/S-methyl-5'-thioadenosine phosphorylase / adenosine deaminase